MRPAWRNWEPWVTVFKPKCTPDSYVVHGLEGISLRLLLIMERCVWNMKLCHSSGLGGVREFVLFFSACCMWSWSVLPGLFLSHTTLSCCARFILPQNPPGHRRRYLTAPSFISLSHMNLQWSCLGYDVAYNRWRYYRCPWRPWCFNTEQSQRF